MPSPRVSPILAWSQLLQQSGQHHQPVGAKLFEAGKILEADWSVLSREQARGILLALNERPYCRWGKIVVLAHNTTGELRLANLLTTKQQQRAWMNQQMGPIGQVKTLSGDEGPVPGQGGAATGAGTDNQRQKR